MKIIIWRIFQEYEIEKHRLFSLKFYTLLEDTAPYIHLFPDIDLNFYKIHVYKDDNYTYIVLDIDKIVPNMPNKDYIYPLLKRVYEYEANKARKSVLKIQKQICQHVYEFQDEMYDNLYLHQINNIAWMQSVEKSFPSFSILQKPYMMLGQNVGINIETYETKYKKDIVEQIRINGGCLMDDYGLGKTRCMVELIEKEKSIETIHPFHLNASLIICHHDLCLVWQDEILKVNPNAKIKILATPSDYGDFRNVDYVILSFKYFTSVHKHSFNFENIDPFQSMAMMKDHCYRTHDISFQVTNFKWRRLVVDDIHEIFRIRQNEYFLNSMHQIDADFKWAITGHQIFHSDAILNIVKFILGKNDILPYFQNSEFCFQVQKHFRKTIAPRKNILEQVIEFNEIEELGYLKQRTKMSKQDYCLFPTMKMYTIPELSEIIQESDQKFFETNLETIKKRFCHICFTNIGNGKLAITPCGHHGCFECMLKAQNINKSCPFCRKELTMDQIYLIDDGFEKLYYGPKIRKLLEEIKTTITFSKVIVYVDSHHIQKLANILHDNDIDYKMLKGTLKYKYNVVKQFDKEDENFILLVTDPIVNYGFKNVNKIIILENMFKDTENKLLSLVNSLGNQQPFTSVTQYMVKHTFETGDN